MHIEVHKTQNMIENYKVDTIRKKHKTPPRLKKIEHCCCCLNYFLCFPSGSPLSQPSSSLQVTISLTFMVATSLLFKILPVFELYT